MEKFKSFISEAKDEPYKLVILSHDDPEDPNDPSNNENSKKNNLDDIEDIPETDFTED